LGLNFFCESASLAWIWAAFDFGAVVGVDFALAAGFLALGVGAFFLRFDRGSSSSSDADSS
jgi:hypothetical protein